MEIEKRPSFEADELKKSVNIVADGLTYKVPSRKNKKEMVTILNDIGIYIPAGSFVAVMGPSGCGKTTFLNLLADRIKTGSVQGEIYYNCVAKKDFDLKHESNYVMQHDTLTEFLTVEETLMFAANLKLKTKTQQQRKLRVELIMSALGLLECRSVLIGGKFRKGISGGQKKRVSIGLELIDDPSLLFLDEPTTGLDSAIAYDTLKILIDLAKQGRTIVATVHQPRSQLFSLFDKLLLLNAGKVVYFGPAKAVTSHLTTIGYPCPPQFNPGDFILDLLTSKEGLEDTPRPSQKTPKALQDSPMAAEEMGEGGTTPLQAFALQEEAERGLADPQSKRGLRMEGGRVFLSPKETAALPDLFSRSSWGQKAKKDLESAKGSCQDETAAAKSISKVPCQEKAAVVCCRETAWFFWQVRMLGWKIFAATGRNPLKTFAAVGQAVFFGIFLGGIYFQLDRNTVTDARDKAGLLFMLTLNLMFSAFTVLPLFPEERAVLNKDNAGGLYSRFVWFTSKTFCELPFNHLAPSVMATIIYFMSGLRLDAGRYFIFLGIANSVVWAAQGFFQCVSALSPSVDIAQVIAPLCFVVFFLVSGFYLGDDDIPDWISWARFIAFTRFGFFAMFLNEIEGQDYRDQQWENIVKDYDMDGETVWENALIVVSLGVGYRVCTFLALTYVHKNLGLES
uniref:ABC transporter domain-containing protein n=1 Tax=Chromera velia CCMP2878 TaxID=1169474 RepID=A0A0G4EZW6_9ALVE|eukprot:Cvel_14503.t1-p1 / transcript=Cvel_14503.t1 / gene=Cvel_14503 / organism=Chromera_velia_CCMP2878 / gene_product=ABC transporter G family member 22, putative / transcript_product=ABC transporter G family member 22, putative / location=Cvel_scaffold1034:44615-52012(-) / protein_length=678 / sequence_SO=supercontig / SO=protein_coding / is_pseudo=false